MITRLAIAALFALGGQAAFGQIQLYSFDGTTETPVGSLYQMPNAAPGDTLITRFHVRNNGSGTASLTTLSIAGESFSISSAPSLPCVIAPGPSQIPCEFRVSFAPADTGSYSANLAVNTLSVFVRGTAVGQAALSSGGTPLAAGTTIDFGKTKFGTTVTMQFALSNPNGTAVTIGKITVAGTAFQGPAGISAPLTLNPGQTIPFTITFTPPTAATFPGTLSLDQRAFPLTGVGLSPPLPSASIQLVGSQLTSAQQSTLSIPLSAASEVSGTGTVTMTFQPSVQGVTDDKAVQFLSGPPRDATITVSPGDSFAKFNGSTTISFQTGTTAGTIQFVLTLGSTTQQSTIMIPPSPVSLQTASGTAEAGSLRVSLVGFDNTYSASQLSFTFYDSSGKMIGSGPIIADATQAFQDYFKSPMDVGGSFLLGANFLVSGTQPLVITGASNTSPIVITTATPMGFSNGDKVFVYDVQGNTGANGTWVLSSVSGSSAVLVGSVGTGAYAGLGEVSLDLVSGVTSVDVSITNSVGATSTQRIQF